MSETRKARLSRSSTASLVRSYDIKPFPCLLKDGPLGDVGTLLFDCLCSIDLLGFGLSDVRERLLGICEHIDKLLEADPSEPRVGWIDRKRLRVAILGIASKIAETALAFRTELESGNHPYPITKSLDDILEWTNRLSGLFSPADSEPTPVDTPSEQPAASTLDLFKLDLSTLDPRQRSMIEGLFRTIAEMKPEDLPDWITPRAAEPADSTKTSLPRSPLLTVILDTENDDSAVNEVAYVIEIGLDPREISTVCGHDLEAVESLTEALSAWCEQRNRTADFSYRSRLKIPRPY